MADENKTIEISYRADLKQLLANLKKMPNMTSQQAKEMVAGLQKQLRQAEKAADRASKNTAKSFKRMEKAAKRTTINARSLRREFANIDRLTSEASQGLALVSPALGDAALQASVAASGVESLGRALMVTNPLFIVGAIVVGGLIAAMSASSEAAKALAESEERLKKALEESQKEYVRLGDSIDNTDKQMDNFRATTADLTNQLLLSRGEISKFEFLSIQNAKELQEFQEKINQTATTRLQTLQLQKAEHQKRNDLINDEIKLLREAKSTFFDNSKINKQISDLQKQQISNNFQQSQLTEEIRITEIRTKGEVRAQIAARKQVLKEMAEQEAIQEALQKSEERRRAAAKAAAEAEKERLAILKQQQTVFDKINDSLKTSQTNQASARNELLDLIAKQDGKEAEIQRNLTKQTDAINDQIRAAQQRLFTAQLRAETDEQIFAAQELEKATVVEIEALEALRHQKRVQMEQDLADLKEANAKKESETKKKLNDQEIANAQSLFNSSMEITNALTDLNEKKGMAARAQAFRLFRVNQAAAIANIGFAIAEGLAQSAGQPLRTAAVIAAGVASTAKVLAQKPPTADMGMIGNNDPLRPDETTTRVLRGEAVIDRATVNRLGGEQGVRALQEGGNAGGNVVVVQPFKHFDRFIKQASQSGAIFRQTKPVSY